MEKNSPSYDDILVEVDSKEMNNNNIRDFAPYTLTELDGSEFNLPKIEKGVPQCELCFRKFQKYTDLYAHKGKFCLEDTAGIESHLIKVNFAPEQLPFIQDCLVGLNKEIKNNDNGALFVEQEAAFVSIFLEQLYTAQVTKYNLEEWYPKLSALNVKFARPVTAPSIFLPLSDEELKMMQGLASANLARAMGMDRRETNKELEMREKLEERLAMVMDPEKVYFCRMSTRSPKDGVSLSAEEKLLPVTERVQRKIRLLQVRNPQQVVDLLTKSQRVFSDINFYFGHRVANSSSAKLFLILREWMEIPQDHEFRCYIVNRKIVAISQYQCYLVFPAMQNEGHVRKIRDAIVEFHEQIKHDIPMHDYVIDIAVFKDFSCSVIELNPMGAAMSSGSALFNWITDADLLSGKLNLDVPPIRVLKRLLDEENATKIN